MLLNTKKTYLINEKNFNKYIRKQRNRDYHKNLKKYHFFTFILIKQKQKQNKNIKSKFLIFNFVIIEINVCYLIDK